MPGDPLDALQDPTTGTFVHDDQLRERVLVYYGLDRPIGEQYVRYLADLTRGDLGWSIRLNQPVAELIGTRLPWTLLLVLPSLAIGSVIATVAGVEAAWARGSSVDLALVVALTVLHAIPIYVLGVLAIALASVQLRWLPLGGAATPFKSYASLVEQMADITAHWLLPATVLIVEVATARFLLLRNTVLAVISTEYIAVARAKGLGEGALKYRHALRNALLPSVTGLAAQLGFALGGAVFVESLFAYPGIGRLLTDAVGARDYPVLQGVFLLMSAAVLLANTVADMAYGMLDPRTRSA